MDVEPENSSLATFLRERRAVFSQKLGKDFEEKKRAKDMRLLFQSAVRRKYPNLSLIWLRGKHGNMAKILFATYSPTQLRAMIERYVVVDDYHEQAGISFDGFYWTAAKIATDLAAATQRAEIVALRHKQVAENDAADPTAADISSLKKSAFFKKLPALFRGKLGAQES